MPLLISVRDRDDIRYQMRVLRRRAKLRKLVKGAVEWIIVVLLFVILGWVMGAVTGVNVFDAEGLGL